MTVTAQQLASGIAFASMVHEHQIDRGGNPYILHPLWIMNQVQHLGFDHMLLAVCHDTLEDGVKNQKFFDIDTAISGFISAVQPTDASILTDLLLLTHVPNDSYSAYIQKIGCYPRPTAIKIQDLRHNSDITRLKGLTDKDQRRIAKYHACYSYLSGDHGRLLDSFS